MFTYLLKCAIWIAGFTGDDQQAASFTIQKYVGGIGVLTQTKSAAFTALCRPQLVKDIGFTISFPL